MIHLRSFGALSLVLALAGLAGCNQPSGDDSADTDVATSELAAEPAPAKPNKGGKAHDKHHGGKHGGPGMLLGAALRELDLTDAQKSIIQGQLDALRQDGEARPDHDAARAELAAAVKSGRVDESALLAKAAPAAPDTTRIAKAVGVLHDTLTAAQRKELVAAVEAKDGEGREGGKRGKHAGREMAGKGMEHGPMGHLLKDLSLSDAQREKVKEALSKLAPNEGDRDAMKA
jgi:Spy/CpxP family protein refolding chaperone